MKTELEPLDQWLARMYPGNRGKKRGPYKVKKGTKPTPTGRGPGHPKGLKANTRSKAVAALAMKREGKTYAFIASKMGRSRERVMRWIHSLLETKRADKRCSICGARRTKKRPLHQHYPIYNHGSEITVCNPCHRKLHGE